MPGNSFYCAPHQVELEPLEDNSVLIDSHPYKQTLVQNNEKNELPSSQLSQPEDETPSFNAITDGLQDTIQPCMTAYQTSTYNQLGSSSQLVKPATHSNPRFFNPGTSFLYSNSPLRPFKINSPKPDITFGTPLNDTALVKMMDEFEAKSRQNEIHAGKKQFQHFSSATNVQQPNYLQFQQVIFSSPVQIEFYKAMTAALPTLDSRYFFIVYFTML